MISQYICGKKCDRSKFPQIVELLNFYDKWATLFQKGLLPKWVFDGNPGYQLIIFNEYMIEHFVRRRISFKSCSEKTRHYLEWYLVNHIDCSKGPLTRKYFRKWLGTPKAKELYIDNQSYREKYAELCNDYNGATLHPRYFWAVEEVANKVKKNKLKKASINCSSLKFAEFYAHYAEPKDSLSDNCKKCKICENAKLYIHNCDL